MHHVTQRRACSCSSRATTSRGTGSVGEQSSIDLSTVRYSYAGKNLRILALTHAGGDSARYDGDPSPFSHLLVAGARVLSGEDLGSCMPRFYFDLHDGEWDRDDVGSDLADADHAVLQAKRTLPAIALDMLPRGGDRHAVTMLVTDEDARLVYTATLSFSGLVLALRLTPPAPEICCPNHIAPPDFYEAA